MLAMSCYLVSSAKRPGVLLNIFQCIRQPHSKELFGQNVNSTNKLRKPLLTRLISHSTFSIYCTNPLLHFSCTFTFLEIINHNTLKMLHIFFYSSILKSFFNIKMTAQKFTNFDKFSKNTDMTAVTKLF